MPISKRKKQILKPVNNNLIFSDICSPRSFWTVVLFTVVFIIQILLVGVVTSMYQRQLLIVKAFDALSDRSQFFVTSSGKQDVPSLYKETEIVGIYFDYKPCKPTFTGACDDAALYFLAKDGSKQVLIPSVRNLSGAPMTSEILQPLSQSLDGRWIVFGAWAFGSKHNDNDHRIWLFDKQANNIVLNSNVPSEAVFSPDYKYAAYASSDGNGDLRDITILDIWSGKDVGGAKAATDVTFMGPEGKAMLRWGDANNLFIQEFTRTDMENTIPVLRGEKNLKVK